MPYTLWSKGRLVATTDLGFTQCFPNWRSGWLEPALGSEPLIARAVAVSPAMMNVTRRVRTLANARGPNGRVDPESEELRGSTEYADLQAALHAEAALELELRGPDGVVIPSVSIGIKDTYYMLAMVRHSHLSGYEPLDDDPRDPSITLEQAIAAAATEGREPWEPAWPRYQVMVEFPEGEEGEDDSLEH